MKRLFLPDLRRGGCLLAYREGEKCRLMLFPGNTGSPHRDLNSHALSTLPETPLQCQGASESHPILSQFPK